MSRLFSPFSLRGITFNNRIAVSPMCQYSAEDGFANDWHLVHLGARAVGGAGLVVQEATAVTPDGRISYADLGLWKDEHISMLQRIVAFISAQGSVPGIQLAHAGRKSSAETAWNGGKQIKSGPNSWQTCAPSAFPYYESDMQPHALTQNEIRRLQDDFVKATERALEAGYKVIELHAAHGYLFHQFYSPLSNLRTDEYGGSFENRVRFLLDTTKAVRKVMPDELPLFVRISATEWVPEGWTIDDSVRLVKLLQNEGVDLIDVSSAANIPKAPIPVGPLYQVPLAAQIKKETGIATAAVGLITTAREAEHILETEKADMVFLARQLLRDPYFPLHAAKELGDEIAWPKQYERAKLK